MTRKRPGAEGDHRKKLVRSKAKRAAATLMVARFGLSQRRVCQLVALDRNTLRYQSRRSDDQGLGARMREIAETKRRYGCPRIYVRLRRVLVIHPPAAAQRAQALLCDGLCP